MENKIEARHLNLYYGQKHALKHVSLDIKENKITAFIGPSGCGKSTFLKTLNRMNDLVESTKITGDICLDGTDIYKNMDAIELRRRVGMVFQQPNPFPKSIYDNIAYGPRIFGIKKKSELDKFYTRPEVAKECLSLLFSTINIEDYSVIEPSAGSGAFSNQINGCHAYDILPEGSNITEQDFLSLDFNDFHKNVCVVGNPPFGERNSLTKSFIKENDEERLDKLSKIVPFFVPFINK